jgi:outer membrane protein OmpA-like peptidoglycan-associated protein
VKLTKATLSAVTAALVLATTGCAKPAGDPPGMSVPDDPPAALAIVAAQPRADRAAAAALAAGSARTGEQLEIVSGSGKVLGSGAAPAPPVIAGPVPPPALSADPTQFQVQSHQRQEAAYTARLKADRQLLARLLTSRLSAWAAATTDAMTRSGSRTGSDPGPGITAAATFFTSLQQTGLNLGPRRVLVIFGASGLPGSLPPASLTGITVILANFPGSLRAQEEWQAALLQAGAARAIVLVPAAADELIQATRQGLAGQAGPAPADVYFRLNQASLDPAARATLHRLALELTTTYPDAAVTILGFADPLGSPARNAILSADRARACEAYLVRHGIAAARISAVGYGTDLPAAPIQPDGAQPLDRRVIAIIDPVI